MSSLLTKGQEVLGPSTNGTLNLGVPGKYLHTPSSHLRTRSQPKAYNAEHTFEIDSPPGGLQREAVGAQSRRGKSPRPAVRQQISERQTTLVGLLMSKDHSSSPCPEASKSESFPPLVQR